jgi:Cytochrome c peroxidase
MKKVLLTSLGFTAVLLIAAPSKSQEEPLTKARQYFSPLPKDFFTKENSVYNNPKVINLGKMLFFERRLSVNDNISCATCHAIEYYGSAPAKKQMGVIKFQDRHTPTVLNSAGQFVQHWIGNRKDVEDQAIQSLTGPAAFGNKSLEDVEDKISKIEGYVKLFKEAFPNDSKPISGKNIAIAIGAYERTLTTPSRFDEYLKGNTKALNQKEKKGLITFIEVGCVACHNGPLVGGNSFQKFGVVAPYWEYTKNQSIDEGRYLVTKKEEDKYVYKVPSLRNVALTPPYFHDGSVEKLEDAVKIMAKVQLGKDLTNEDIDNIVAFLNALTGNLPKNFREPPILPSK